MYKYKEINDKFKDRSYNNKTLEQVWNIFLDTKVDNLHGRDVIELNNLFLDKTTCSYQITMFLYYSSFKNKNKVTHWTFEQLAYMAKCSYALVEKTIKKLKTAGILEHTVNEHNKFKHLKKATLKQMGCNPFKWVFTVLKKICNKTLQAAGFRTNFIAPAKEQALRQYNWNPNSEEDSP